MDFFTGIFAFLLIWWTALFIVLPLWVRQPDRHEAGHMPGAPENPYLFKKFLVTTGLSAIIWLFLFVAVESRIIDFRAISFAMIEEDSQR